MRLTVREVMTKRPLTIDREAPIGTAIAVMREREIRHLPVVDEEDRPIGIISDRDLRGTVLAPAIAEYLPPAARDRLQRLGEAFENLRVRDVMTWDVVTIAPDAPVAQAAALMFDRRLGCLPVMELGRLVGIVTERDILKALAATLPSVRGGDAGLW